MKNINPKEKLINGSRGIVKNFVTVVNEYQIEKIVAISVLFDFQSESDTPYDIPIIQVNSYKGLDGKIYQAYQFPLRLSWAVTAHKSQGQTLNRVAIDISSPAFAHGAFYVALSRVRKLSDIVFFGVKDWPKNGIQFHNNEFISGADQSLHDEAIHENMIPI